MPDTCPECGAVMLDDTLSFVPKAIETRRCAECDYWVELIEQDDGTLAMVGKET